MSQLFRLSEVIKFAIEKERERHLNFMKSASTKQNH